MILFAFWFALEANGLRRWTLERRGYVLVGVVEGRTLEEAERRFFAEAGATPTSPTVAASIRRHGAVRGRLHRRRRRRRRRRRAERGIVGLFPAPGHRR